MRDEQRRESDGEGEVAPPVDLGGRANAVVAQALVAPDGADDAKGHRDPKDEAPVDDREQSAGDETDERAADRRDLVDAHGETALVDRERRRPEWRPQLAKSIAPPTPCTRRQITSQRAPELPLKGSSASSTDAKEKTAKPRLKMRTRPTMSPSRPRLMTSTAVTRR